MSAISSAPFVIGSQIPIPVSVNQNSSSNPDADLNTQKNVTEATNAGSAASNTAATGESFLQGVISNLGPTNKV